MVAASACATSAPSQFAFAAPVEDTDARNEKSLDTLVDVTDESWLDDRHCEKRSFDGTAVPAASFIFGLQPADNVSQNESAAAKESNNEDHRQDAEGQR